MNKQMSRWIILWLTVTCGFSGRVAWADVKPPTGDRDLILLIARYDPKLYRLVGQQLQPFGTAQFYSPNAIVADLEGQCFYVFDEPKLTNEPRKIWRIEPDGTARVIAQALSKNQGGPFSNPTGLGIDRTGQLLIADTVTGLWQLGSHGQFRCLFDGKNKPLYKISAATDSPRGLVLATNFLDTVTGGNMLGTAPDLSTGVGNSTGRQVPIRVWKNQGGLHLMAPNVPASQIRTVLINRKPDGGEYDTYWRTANQILVDAAGRIVLVDAGSIREQTEDVYTGSQRRTDHPQTRKTKSDISGGLFVLHPDGRFEDLTFKTANQSSGPLRHPHGAAQWSDKTYLVADPEMYVEGITGAGGLLLLNLDGSRQARWPFGQRLRPLGVAIIRAAGPAAHAVPTGRIDLADLAGLHISGKITRITSASWERKGQGGGLMGPPWESQSTQNAEARLRAVFENARWSVEPDNVLFFCGSGVIPQTAGTPLIMQGKVTAFEGMLSASASYKSQSMFDTQFGSLDARLYSAGPGMVTIDMKVQVFTNNERLKGAFEQTMPLKGH